MLLFLVHHDGGFSWGSSGKQFVSRKSFYMLLIKMILQLHEVYGWKKQNYEASLYNRMSICFTSQQG